MLGFVWAFRSVAAILHCWALVDAASSPAAMPTIRHPLSPTDTRRPTTMVRTQLTIFAVSALSEVTVEALNSTAGRQAFSAAATVDQVGIYPEDVTLLSFKDNITMSDIQNVRALQDKLPFEVSWMVQFAYEERGFANETEAYESYVNIYESNLQDDDFIGTLRFSDFALRDAIHISTVFTSVDTLNLSPTGKPTYAPASSPSGESNEADTFVPVIVTFIVVVLIVCCVVVYCLYIQQKEAAFEQERKGTFENVENGVLPNSISKKNAKHSIQPEKKSPIDPTENNLLKLQSGNGRILPTKYSPKKSGNGRFSASIVAISTEPADTANSDIKRLEKTPQDIDLHEQAQNLSSTSDVMNHTGLEAAREYENFSTTKGESGTSSTNYTIVIDNEGDENMSSMKGHYTISSKRDASDIEPAEDISVKEQQETGDDPEVN